VRKFIIVLLVLSLMLAVPLSNAAYAGETYVRRTEFNATDFTLGLLMEGAGVYVFCLTWAEAEEKDGEVKLKWGYAVLGTLMMILGADWMVGAWTVKVERVSQMNDERTYLIVGRRF